MNDPSSPSTPSVLLGQALDLSIKDRAALAAAILASLDGEPEEGVEGAWVAEAERRARKSLAGKTQPQDWEDVYRELKQSR